MISFADRFRSTLEALELTAYGLAGKHSLNRSSMFNMLRSKTRPNLDMLERLCELEPAISAEYLIRGEGPPLREFQNVSAVKTIQQLRDLQEQINKIIEDRVNELSVQG